MIKLKNQVVKRDDGSVVELTALEKSKVRWVQNEINTRFKNQLGYEVPITTLTAIVKKISEQSFYEIPPADYLPIRVGEGAWSTQLTTFRSFDVAGEFEEGIINTGANNSRLANADAAVDAVNVKTFPWAKGIGWSIFDLEYAARNGNWDIVSAKEKARKTNWDLGIQRIAFLGADGQNAAGGSCLGLLNQAGITNNTTVITKAIKSMSAAELKTFQGAIISAYRTNCNYTKWPTHFIIPESDYTGLAAQASADYPMKSILELLLDAFKVITRNPNFKILPLAYADASVSGDSVQKYMLLNYDDESIRMDIPVDYTNTLANSIDNFSFQNVGYGQFTGVMAYRPRELMYFTYSA